MEKDTVLLTIEEYNELRDFKKEIEEKWEKSKFVVIEERWDSAWRDAVYSRKYYIESEIVSDFEKRNKKLEAKNEELKIKNKELEVKIKKFNTLINDIKEMSYWEFYKWHKAQKIN